MTLHEQQKSTGETHSTDSSETTSSGVTLRRGSKGTSTTVLSLFGLIDHTLLDKLAKPIDILHLKLICLIRFHILILIKNNIRRRHSIAVSIDKTRYILESGENFR